MNVLKQSKRTQVIAALVEGNSINAIARMTGVSKVILRLLEQMGRACAEYHNAAMRNLKVKRVQCDEIWALMHRFTRLTNGFSKKIENHGHAVAQHFMHYNFCRIHKTLRVTPAMEAGLTDHVWTLDKLLGLLKPPTTDKRREKIS